MIDIKDKKECCGCSACATICPQKCISMKSDDEGFLYPLIQQDRCVECGLCDEVCPMKKKDINRRKKTKTYGCYNKNNVERYNSTSGGVFFLLCKYIIEEKNGIVFGAKFDEKFNVVHDYAMSLEECILFQGSKYVQSKMNNSYKEAEKFLKQGKVVLFTGTPCQIEGLYSYLRKDFDNLYTQDIVCHSVPSPLVWDEYKTYIAQNRNIKNICFRNKKTGWETATFLIEFCDSTVYECEYGKDDYIVGFLNGLYVRSSCNDCKFASVNRNSDITLADFWGVSMFYPQLYDKKGTSLVLINSKKGKELFKFIKESMKAKRVSLKKAIWFNNAIYTSVSFNPNKKLFFEDKNKDIANRIRDNLYTYKKEEKTYKFTFVDKICMKIKRW